MATGPFPAPVSGTEWLIDAHGCDPAALRDVARLTELFQRLMTSPLTVLFAASIRSPEPKILAPLSSIFKTASVPTVLLLGCAPGWE